MRVPGANCVGIVQNIAGDSYEAGCEAAAGFSADFTVGTGDPNVKPPATPVTGGLLLPDAIAFVFRG